MAHSISIGFWGTGNMAKAMMQGLISQKIVAPKKIFCISKTGASAQAFAGRSGVNALATSGELVKASDILVLAFKPFQLAELSAELVDVDAQWVLSVLAGTSLEKLHTVCPKVGKVVRTMPNTPGRIGEGITAYCTREPLNNLEKSLLRSVLGSLGEVVEIDESLMDVFTAVAGSGPAYVFEFIAALAEAGEKEGLEKGMALQLARQTVFGAAALAKQTGEHPVELRNQVTSKGGTTQAGLEAMATANFREVIRQTVQAAKNRSIEMGK